MNQFTTLQLELMRQALRNAVTTIEIVIGDVLTPIDKRGDIQEYLWMTPASREIAESTCASFVNDYYKMVDACCQITHELAHRRGVERIESEVDC